MHFQVEIFPNFVMYMCEFSRGLRRIGSMPARLYFTASCFEVVSIKLIRPSWENDWRIVASFSLTTGAVWQSRFSVPLTLIGTKIILFVSSSIHSYLINTMESWLIPICCKRTLTPRNHEVDKHWNGKCCRYMTEVSTLRVAVIQKSLEIGRIEKQNREQYELFPFLSNDHTSKSLWQNTVFSLLGKTPPEVVFIMLD